MSPPGQPLRDRACLTACSRGAAIFRSLRRNPGDQYSEPSLPQLSLHTPVGDITLTEEDGSIVALDWGWGRDQSISPQLAEARRQLHAYFDGERSHFALNLAPHGTPYRRRVWQALIEIPPGQTRSYAELAATAGGSARSVGGAMANNPIPIIIPCHRIVASGGPGGYSGGDGLPTKRFLLALEQRRASSFPTDQPRLEFT
jgi:methylated-DNA-[protein]-cysteine S-methyltransferase